MQVMIEAAINGNQSRERNPNVPYTPQEIADDAIACCKAGASIIHFHVRDSRSMLTQDVQYYGDAIRRMRAGCDAVLWPTIPEGENAQERYAHFFKLCADPATRPDLSIVDTGSVNLATYDPATRTLSKERIYRNSYEHIRYFLGACRELKLKPTLQVFDASFLRAALVFLEQGLLDEPLIVKFYLGAPARPIGLPPTRRSIEAYLDMLKGVRCAWFGSVLGGDVMPLLPDILELGGHVRVGFEDYLHDAGTPPTNVQVVERAAAAIRALGHDVATPAQARQIIGIA